VCPTVVQHPHMCAQRSSNISTCASQVRVFGSDAALISYVRLTQKGGSSPVTARAEETRAWEKRGGKWVLVST